MMVKKKLDYFATSLWKRLAGVDCDCPNCHSKTFQIKDRKYFVTELRRCEDCRLLYRVPADSKQDNRSFYQKRYASGFTTKLPDDDALARLMAGNFAETDHGYGYYITVLTSLGLAPGHRVFDYGCSWGYGSWQLADVGLDVVAYEISHPRAAFAGEKLGVQVLKELPDPTATGDLAETFDCFFSSHVIEHVPQPSKVIELAGNLLKRGGYFVAFTPNGADDFRSVDPEAWHKFWGKVHPNLIDDEFWKRALGDRPMLLGRSPVDCSSVSAFHKGESVNERPRLDGGELMCIARF